MTNKLYEKIKNFIKANYKFIIFYIVFILLFTVSFDYEIYTPGGLSNLDDRIIMDDEYPSKGTFNLTYVNAKKGTLPMILLSYIIPSWDLVSIDDSRIENEDYDEILKRGKIDLTSVNSNAIVVAFNEANLDYKIDKNDLTVYYVFDSSHTNLKVGDIITKVDNVSVNNTDEFRNIINTKKSGDTVEFTIIRNNKTMKKTGEIYESDGSLLVGIYLTNVMEVSTDKNIKFKYSGNESGSSGGLMSALEIYNNITKDDITKGLTIAGTGTISSTGEVGEIAGVKYKLAGAVKNKADVFIAPTNNYKEALSEKEKNNYDIKIIEAKTFKQVLESLEDL